MALTDPLQSNAFTKSGGGVDYSKLQSAVTDTAAKAREVDVPAFPDINIPSASSAERSMVGALKGSYESQSKATTAQAGKAGTALEVAGAGSEQYLKQLEGIAEEKIPELEASSTARWNEATEKADEYVQASRDRVQTSLKVIDDLNAEIGENRNFAKAHDMQAAVQSTIGQMNAEGRNIAETYGMDSKEYQAFTGSKKMALAGAFSNITASYHKIQEQQDLAFMSATNETQYKHNMYASYQEQQHVTTIKYMAQAQDNYDLQLAQFEVSVEGLRMAGLENIANWLVSTPTYAMDLTPFMASVLNIEQAAETRRLAEEQLALAKEEGEKEPTLFMANRGGKYNWSWTWGMGKGGTVKGGVLRY